MSQLPSTSKSAFQNNKKHLSLLHPCNPVLFWSVEAFSILFESNFSKRKKVELSRGEKIKSLYKLETASKPALKKLALSKV